MKYTWLLLLLFSFPALAEIYRWVDENGNVVFTDEPHPQAEKIEVSPSTVYTPDDSIRAPEPDQPPLTLSPEPDTSDADNEAPATSYDLRIIAPSGDESIWSNNGDLTVSMIVEPALDAEQGHKILLQLDGEAVSEPRASTTFQLNNLNRGTHTLDAMVVDDNGNTFASSPVISFQLHRTSIQNNTGLTPPGPTGGRPSPTPGAN